MTRLSDEVDVTSTLVLLGFDRLHLHFILLHVSA